MFYFSRAEMRRFGRAGDVSPPRFSAVLKTRGIHIPRSPNCTTIWDARENCSPAIARLAQFSDGSFTRYGSKSLALKNCCSATS